MSIHYEIVSQAVAGVSALDSSLTVVARKRPTIEEGDSLVTPLVIISPEQEDELGEDHFELNVTMAFPIRVTIVINPGDLAGSAQLSTMLQLRQDIRRLLRSVKAVVPSGANTVTGVRFISDAPFDRSAVKDVLDVSSMIFVYEVDEERNV